MDPLLLETDILTEIFKLRNQSVAANAAAYLQQLRPFTFSAKTLFDQSYSGHRQYAALPMNKGLAGLTIGAIHNDGMANQLA